MAKELVSATEGGGESPVKEEYLKKLFVVEPLEVDEMVTQFSKGTEQEFVRANIYVVLAADGSKFEEFEDVLVFQSVLIGQIKRKIGSYVVGRLTQGENKKGNPPWKLAEATERDMAAAKAFLASQMTSSAGSGSTGDDGFEAEAGDEDAF